MTWQLAIFLHLAMSTVFTLVQRRYAKNDLDNPMLSMAFMYVFTILPFGLVHSLFFGGVEFSYEPRVWVAMVAGGVIFAFGNSLAFTAISKIEAAQATVLGNFRTITTVAVSGFLLGEVLSPLQYTGAAFILIAILIIASTKTAKGALSINKYSVLALISATLFGLGLSNEKYILDSMELSSYCQGTFSCNTLSELILAA